MKKNLQQSQIIVLWKKFAVHLQDPFVLRVFVLSMIAVVGLGGVGLPLYHKTSVLREQLTTEKQRQSFIKENNYITKKMKKYKKRLPKQKDLDAWVEYLINASRKFDVKVVEYKPFPVKGIQARSGGLQGILLRFDFMAPYERVLKLIGWLENQQTALRIARVYMLKESMTAPLKTNITFGIFKGRKKLKKKDKQEKKKDVVKRVLTSTSTVKNVPSQEPEVKKSTFSVTVQEVSKHAS